MKLAFTAVLSLAISFSAADQPRTVITTEGIAYNQAEITELRPTGVVLTTDAGIAVVPYAKLPNDLKALYGPNIGELEKAIGKSLDGIYEMPREQTGFGGERIILKNDRFIYQWVSDSAGGGELRGRFTREEHWITFHHKAFPFPNRVLTVIGGKLTLLTPEDFRLWRERGDMNRTRLSRAEYAAGHTPDEGR